MSEVTAQAILGAFVAREYGQQFAQLTLVVREPLVQLGSSATDTRAGIDKIGLKARFSQVQGSSDTAYSGTDD